jgi:putative hemolysin
MDDLIGDYEVTTVRINRNRIGNYSKTRTRTIWNKLEFEVIDMDVVKIDKVLVSNIKV